jgi:Domain of unknown function (DUF4249)
MKITSTILFLAIIFFSSCTDIIELDLKESEPRVIIEATLNATDSTCSVSVTTSSAFYDTTAAEGVTGMDVVLTKNGISPVLLGEITPGNYFAENIVADSSDVFSISLTDKDGVVYTASGKTPTVPGQFLTLFASMSDQAQHTDSAGNVVKFLFGLCYWFDTPIEENYYRFKIFKNNEYLARSYNFVDDKSAIGDTMQTGLSEFFIEGDTVTIQLLSINKESFDYFLELQEVISAGSNSTTPFNPIGNFDNDALGYFCIQHVVSQDFIVFEFPFF